MANSQEEGGRAVQRTQLEARLAAVNVAANTLEASRRQWEATTAQRSKIVSKASELRDQRFAARKRVAEDLTRRLDGAIRVTISQAADVSEYSSLLADALKGIGVKQVVTAERIAAALLPDEIARAVKLKDVAALVAAGLDEARARRIIDALALDGKIYELEFVELRDVPRIELLDGDHYKDSPTLSTGQRCTTILPILLVQSERPLIVDQPEDNLDNKFIYDTVVKAIRQAKGRRQVIFVTHNPNIPVLGEAERIFVLRSDGRRAFVHNVGSVDECKEDIETILEGGREAFRQRQVRYGH